MLLEVDDLASPKSTRAGSIPPTIPARIQELDGTRVVVYGAMFPPPLRRSEFHADRRHPHQAGPGLRQDSAPLRNRSEL